MESDKPEKAADEGRQKRGEGLAPDTGSDAAYHDDMMDPETEQRIIRDVNEELEKRQRNRKRKRRKKRS